MGRVLLATVWQHLIAGGQWQKPQWEPPDGLPALTKPSPAECLNAEAIAVLNQMLGDNTSAQVVLAIPNQLPEESQELLLGRLPANARLIWRSVAAAMSWAAANANHMPANRKLAVLDAGLEGVEISVFSFRQQEVDGQMFSVPVRRTDQLRHVRTDHLLADSPAPFSLFQPVLTALEQHLSEISNAIGGTAELLVCGPMAESLLTLARQRFPQIGWQNADANAVAQGSSLFAWRLDQKLPTYLDVLPALELFTLTEEREPNWLALIPTNCEVPGGHDFQQVYARRIFIEKGTTRLGSWLQRSGESEFRKLSTELPVQATGNAWVDLKVCARPAGGFARVEISLSKDQPEVLGGGQSLLLNWQSMERIARGPQDKWPPVSLKYGWPASGRLYAHRPLFDDFLLIAKEKLMQALESFTLSARITALRAMKLRVAKTIAPHLAGVTEPGGDAAPLNSLVCFSTALPCEFLAGEHRGVFVISKLSREDDRARRIALLLWERLKVLVTEQPQTLPEVNEIVFILGRMGGYAPEAFQDWLASQIHPVSKLTRLFAAGRALRTPQHGLHLFKTIKEKADFGQTLNLNWLRMLVYFLYQRPDALQGVPREHVVAAARLCLDVFQQQVEQRNHRILFMNSLRALGLLLRMRRHSRYRDFLSIDNCPHGEVDLANRFKSVLRQANLTDLRRGPKTLVERVGEWLDFVASTDEMPPIAPPDEDDDAEGANDD